MYDGVPRPSGGYPQPYDADGTSTFSPLPVPPVVPATPSSGSLDPDLTAIAALDSTQAGVIASTGAGWSRLTYAELKTALALTKSDVGLGSVDNTSDADKPVSIAQAQALALKADAASLGNAATRNVGITSGTVAAGDDSRFAGIGPGGSDIDSVQIPVAVPIGPGSVAITHNLGFVPAGIIFHDQDGNQVEIEVVDADTTSITINLYTRFVGTVNLS